LKWIVFFSVRKKLISTSVSARIRRCGVAVQKKIYHMIIAIFQKRC